MSNSPTIPRGTWPVCNWDLPADRITTSSVVSRHISYQKHTVFPASILFHARRIPLRASAASKNKATVRNNTSSLHFGRHQESLDGRIRTSQQCSMFDIRARCLCHRVWTPSLSTRPCAHPLVIIACYLLRPQQQQTPTGTLLTRELPETQTNKKTNTPCCSMLAWPQCTPSP
jgi:hypothetical protein